MTAFCFLLAFFLAAPSSYRVDRGRHLASSTFAGVEGIKERASVRRKIQSEHTPETAGRVSGPAWRRGRCLRARPEQNLFV